MGRKNTSLEKRLWRGSVMLHGLLFTLFWAVTFYEIAFNPSNLNDYNNSLPVLVMLWIPFLIIHIIASYHYTQKPENTDLERQAYREGFADGMRERANIGDSYNSRRLSIDDEGELIEDMPESNKRKREMR